MTDFSCYRCRQKLKLGEYSYNILLFNIGKLDSVKFTLKKNLKKRHLKGNIRFFFDVTPAFNKKILHIIIYYS